MDNMLDFSSLDGAVLCYFKKGSYIMRNDDCLECLYYLIKGVVVRNILSKNGEETRVAIRRGGEKDNLNNFLGILSLFTKEQTLGYSSFVAKTDCECYRIPVSSVRRYIDNNPIILRQLLYQAMEIEREMLNMYHQRRDCSTVSQICYTILDNSKMNDFNEVVIRPFKNKDLSLLFGVHEVTVSRILGALQREGILKKDSGRWYILDIERLKKIANDEEKLNYRYE